MNDIMRGKIEACLELSGGKAQTFKDAVMQVTGFTDQGFHGLNLTDIAYKLLSEGYTIDSVLEIVF